MKELKKLYNMLIAFAFTFIVIGVFLMGLYLHNNKDNIYSFNSIDSKYKTISFNVTDVTEKIIIYDNLTYDELVEKINKSLNSTLTNMGKYFVDSAIKYQVDPYLAVAISLHETGCKWNCSSLVTKCNNIGGIKGSPSCGSGGYQYFESLEAGIDFFVKNIANNYYAYGYTTAEAMQKKYTGYENSTWAVKVNSYINIIKNN